MSDTPYDALSIELERIQVLADFLEKRLSEDGQLDGDDYALSLIADNISECCDEARELAKTLNVKGAK